MSDRITFDQFFTGISSLKKILTKGAPDLDELSARLMFKVFEHLSPTEWGYIITASVNTFKFWPAPAEMLELLIGTHVDIAEITAAALCNCVETYKSQGALYESRILPKIGPVGDALVKSKGGWVNFVALTDETPMGVFKKQLVDEVKANIARERREALMPPEMKVKLPAKAQDEIDRLCNLLSLN